MKKSLNGILLDEGYQPTKRIEAFPGSITEEVKFYEERVIKWHIGNFVLIPEKLVTDPEFSRNSKVIFST